MGKPKYTETRRCSFFEKYFIEKIKKFKSVFEKIRKNSKKIEKKFTTQFVLSNHCFWFKTSIFALKYDFYVPKVLKMAKSEQIFS
jgi:hypothetical protein